MRLALGIVLWAAAAGLAWADQPSLAQKQVQAKKQQTELRREIDALQKDIEDQESARQDATNALKASESAISSINAKLAQLQVRTASAQQKLEELNAQTLSQHEHLARRRHELASQLRAQYASGLSPWTALLSGEDPRSIGRDLAYLGYISAAQVKALRHVRDSIEELAQLQGKTRVQHQDLAQLFQQTGEQKKELEEQEAERRDVLDRIEEQLKRQRSQAGQLAAGDKRLGTLIEGLEAAIAKQAEEARIAEEKRKAEAARKAEQQRLAALERQRALERERQLAREAEHQEKVQAADQALAAEKAREAQRAAEQKAGAAAAARAQSTAEPRQGLRKGMPYPVRGDVLGRFGAARPDGGVWRGVVLRSAEGTPVHAIAGGRVAYSSWLASFGNIIIIDHGQGYLSVYAHNQSLLKEVGEQVSAGSTIATVGATGGQVDPGLYFEIRHNGIPVNPLLWLAP